MGHSHASTIAVPCSQPLLMTVRQIVRDAQCQHVQTRAGPTLGSAVVDFHFSAYRVAWHISTCQHNNKGHSEKPCWLVATLFSPTRTRQDLASQGQAAHAMCSAFASHDLLLLALPTGDGRQQLKAAPYTWGVPRAVQAYDHAITTAKSYTHALCSVMQYKPKGR